MGNEAVRARTPIFDAIPPHNLPTPRTPARRRLPAPLGQNTMHEDRLKNIAREVNASWAKKYPNGRDPARIDAMLAELRELWLADDQLRLGQLIVNIVNPREPSSEVYNVEDDEFRRRLGEYRQRRAQ